MKLNRNAPCPCGSGKKIKKCCIDKIGPKPISIPEVQIFPEQQIYIDEEVDQLSNKVNDLINSKSFEEALEGCKTLVEKYPDYSDGIERFAELYEQKGDIELALKYYKQAINFTSPCMTLSEEMIEYFHDKIDELSTKKNE